MYVAPEYIDQCVCTFAHTYLHRVGQLVRTDTLQNKHLLKVIKISIPMSWQWLSVWIYAVKDLLKPVSMFAKFFS